MNGDSFDTLLQTITLGCSPRPVELFEACGRALEVGARPFEVVVGAPDADHGARLTFERPADPAPLGDAFGLADHPWGAPDWIGLRWSEKGGLKAKPYHRLEGRESPALPPWPEGAPAGLRAVMASHWQDRTETYYRYAIAGPWSAFVTACLGVLGAPVPATQIVPRPAELGFWVSFGWRREELETVTVGADSRCWSDDHSVAERWSVGLSEGDLESYRRSLAAVRSLGPRPHGGWHNMLAWKCDRRGAFQRAVSLRVPPPSSPPSIRP
ncbi:MAG: hypothetical protein AAF604_22925 [Acidobacteriota bacterium]